MDRLVDEILRRVQEKLGEAQAGLCRQEKLEESETGPLCQQEKLVESETGPLRQEKLVESETRPLCQEKLEESQAAAPCWQEEGLEVHPHGTDGLPPEFTDSVLKELARRVADILVHRQILVGTAQQANGTSSSQADMGTTFGLPKTSDGSYEAPPEKEKEKGAVLMKRVLSEKDMISVCSPGVTVLHVLRHAVFTDLAKDYVKSRGIQVIRDR